MVVEETFDVGASSDEIYRLLNDVGEIGYCIAGVKHVEVISALESRWKIEQTFGFMARSFTLEARITEQRPGERIAFLAKGQDVNVTGYLNLVADGQASTSCHLTMQVDATGALAPLVDLFAAGPQQALIYQTLNNLREKLESATGSAPGAPLVAPPRERRGLLGWLRSLFGTRKAAREAR
jgi:carbon monoxide dehydrogenase subunit G